MFLPPENAPQPFADLLILELASVLAGPQVGQFFAELGATVLKIEAPAGDVTRTWKTSAETAETDISAYFAASNWGKQSVVLDLTTAPGQAALRRLAARADVVLVSYKPGDAEKLSADYATLSAVNPRLLYGHITGYGSVSNRAGYDAVLQAEAGFMYLNGPPGTSPLKMPVALIDLLAAHQLKQALLTALYQRTATGRGALVEVALFDSALAALANQAATWLVTGHDPRPMGSGHPSIMPYGTVYQGADGCQLVLAVGSDRQFELLCGVLDRPVWATDLRFQANTNRVANRAALEDLLGQRIGEVSGEKLLQELERLAVPAGAVRTVGEALSGDNAAHMILPPTTDFPHAGLRTVAFKSSTWAPAQTLAGPPHLAEHQTKTMQLGEASDQKQSGVGPNG